MEPSLLSGPGYASLAFLLYEKVTLFILKDLNYIIRVILWGLSKKRGHVVAVVAEQWLQLLRGHWSAPRFVESHWNLSKVSVSAFPSASDCWAMPRGGGENISQGSWKQDQLKVIQCTWTRIYYRYMCMCVCGKMCVWPCGKQEEKEIERSREARFLDRKCTLFTVTSLEFSHSNGLSASPRSHGSHGASNGVSGSRWQPART